MKHRTIAVVLALLALATVALQAADKPMAKPMAKPAAAPPAAAPAMPSEADMQAMMKAGQPGPQHQHLAKMAGDWTFTNTAWMAPGQPPMQTTGTMHADSMMGGRYVEHHWSGNFMGQPFEGRGTDGYDNVAKHWVSSWIDNMGTGIMQETGSCNETMSTCNYSGEEWDPMTGKKSTMRSVITWVDDNTFKNEMYAPGPDGKEMKVMEIVAKRKM